ncbi:MAG: CoA-binding protein [Chloroflexi bacterium]|nr:CoA-binding protein [Chloroflexota bacterium]
MTTSARLGEFAPIFYPKSQAVIGASADAGKFGGRFLKGLVSFGYTGKLYPVNPQESQILGLKTYSRVGDIPGPVDFATITVPARAVPEIVEECLAKGIKAVQILTAGFKEISEEGRKLEEQLTRTAAKGIRIIGPNCFGVYRRASSLGVRFSKVISYGNACDVNECDLVEYLGEDPETRIITAYLEGVKDGRRFFKLLQRISQTKPVIIYKGGLTRSGARAVHSHTGSLGGEAAVWEAVFKQTAAIGVNNIDELLDAILAFHHLPSHRGRRVAVVGGGGGVSAAAADTCEKMGLSLPLFPAELQKKLLAMIPPVGSSARNPVDVGNPSPPPPMLKRVLEAVLTEGDIDTVIVDAVQMSVSISSMKNGDEQYGDVVRERARVPVDAKKKFGKPIVMVLPVEAMEADAAAVESEGARRHARDYYLGEGIPVFLTLERAARALVNLIGYYERRDAVASSGSNK